METAISELGLPPVRYCVLLLCLPLLASPLVAAPAKPAKIVKVLPHYVDLEGRIALAPSLFERDAYQAVLRLNRTLCSGLRFDVRWKARSSPTAKLKLRLELVTSTGSRERPLALETPVRPKSFGGCWARLALEGEAFRNAGEVIAWRATLWNGDQLEDEHCSFLW